MIKIEKIKFKKRKKKYPLLQGNKDIRNLVRVYKYKQEFLKNNPDYFHLSGFLTFCGDQGEGKTISAVQYIKQICEQYPKCVLVSNVEIEGIENTTYYYESYQELLEMMDTIHNGLFGVVFFIDEIQTLFNSLLKRGMDIRILENISQLRKQRKHIIGTAQRFMKIDKVLREQMKTCIFCHCYFGMIQRNEYIDVSKSVEKDGKLQYKVKEAYTWFHYPEIYESYDTYKIITNYKKEYLSNEKEKSS